MVTVFLFLAVLLSSSGCAARRQIVSDVSLTESGLESELGAALHREILKALPLFYDETINAYLHSIGNQISEQAERDDLNYQFFLLEDHRIYATHAPGGYVYLTTGMLEFLRSEIELAGVLAFEIGGLQLRDPRFSYVTKTLDFLLSAGSIVGPAFGPVGALSVLGLAVVDQMVSSEDSPEKKIQKADEAALNYMVRAGFDPQGFLDVVMRMADEASADRAYLYDHLESHPVGPERIEYLNRIFKSLPLGEQSFQSNQKIYASRTASLRN